MRTDNWRATSRVLAYFIFAAALAWSVGAVSAVETRDAVTISIDDVSARVGEKATIVARVTPRNGYEIAEAYRNRVTTLSAADDGVEFEGQIVRGAVQGGSLVFKIGVTATKPGAHPINGVLRFGFVNKLDGNYHLDIKWEPLIATVTGVQ